MADFPTEMRSLTDPGKRASSRIIMENQIGCAGHWSWQKRQPAPQSKLRELRQRARSACFVPMMQKIKNNRDFQLSQRSLDSMRSLEMTKKAVRMTKKLARDDKRNDEEVDFYLLTSFVCKMTSLCTHLPSVMAFVCTRPASCTRKSPKTASRVHQTCFLHTKVAQALRVYVSNRDFPLIKRHY